MGTTARITLIADRTAVLAVGVVAGFATGLAFNAAGREQVANWFLPGSATTIAPTSAAPPRIAAPAGTPELARPIDPSVRRRVAADGRLRVGVFGDSFGDGVWDALYRTLPREQGYDVLRFSKEATGFTRYNVINLGERAKKQVAAQPIDVAVMSFGANDVYPIFAERKVMPLLSDDWKRVIGERVDRFVAVTRSTGAVAFWVGLPAMGDPVLDAQVQEMNAFFAGRMARLRVPYVETRPQSLDANGRYSAHLPDPKTGRMMLMRTPDGLHMIGVGYQRITAGLVGRIRAYAALARREAGVAAPAPTPTPR